MTNYEGDAALAVERVMTEQEKTIILDKFRNGNLNGAAVADILDILSNHDWGLEFTEPFYENGAADRVRADLGWPSWDNRNLTAVDRMRSALLGMSVLSVALWTGAVPEAGQVRRLVQRVVEP